MRRRVNPGEMKRDLLDRAHMLRLALAIKRASDEALQSVESRLHKMPEGMIRRHPFMGRAIKP